MNYPMVKNCGCESTLRNNRIPMGKTDLSTRAEMDCAGPTDSEVEQTLGLLVM